MNPYQNHGTRTSVFLHHPLWGTVEFAWDSSDWMVVCFHSANATTIPAIDLLVYTFYNKKPMTVEKNMARKMWNDLVERDDGWKTTLVPCAPSSISEEQAVNS